MNIGNKNDILDKLKVFYYSTSLPLMWTYKGQALASLPHKRGDGEILLSQVIKKKKSHGEEISIHDELKETLKNIQENSLIEGNIYHVTNEHEEGFMAISLGESSVVIVGPFLKEGKSDSDINKILRINKIQINMKAKVKEHYEALTVVDSQRGFYSGKLLEMMFGDDSTSRGTVHEEFQADDYFLIEDEEAGTVHEDMERKERIDFKHPPYFLEQQLTQSIRSGNMDNSMLVLTEINSLKRAKLSSNEIRSIKNSLIGSITIFTRAVMQGGVDPETAYNLSDYFIQKVDGFQDVYKLIDFEYSILRSFVNLVEESITLNYSKAVKDAMAYININLTEDLNLKNISNAVYVHPNYLSGIFKKEVGISMSEYIIKKKVEEARYHVKFTDTPIVEISSFYGFCNQSYFTKVFKKYTGHTPYEFRKI